MINWIRKYHVYFWIILIAGLLLYDNNEKKLYAKLYKKEGICTSAIINDVEGYGRGTGYDFKYTFRIKNKTYHSKTDIGNLNIHQAEKLKNKTFMVVFLKRNPHINRVYVKIPVHENFGQLEYKNVLLKKPGIENILEEIPSSSWFWENYF